tara:strand:- start:3060 stop:3512 length:453 start_codon:yes stop_codon:yes gene_type:complete
MDYNDIINDILQDNLLFFLNNTKIDCNDEYYYSKICNLITYFKNKNQDVDTINTYKSDIQKRLSKIDDYVYRKPWNKLSKEQRLIKLKEFLNNLIKDAVNIEIIKYDIMQLFEKNKLNSAKLVNYEPFSSKIIGINNLNFDTESNKYIFN